MNATGNGHTNQITLKPIVPGLTPIEPDELDALEQLLTAEDVAKLLKVEVKTVYGWIRPRNKNPLPHVKLGKKIRFKEARVRVWCDAQEKK